jgi:hydrogenase 3 maturation protease
MREQSPDNPFQEALQGRVVLLGVGNSLVGDDGLGPALVERVGRRTKAVCINAGIVPESFTRRIAGENPDTLLVIDAVHLGREAGEYELLTPQALQASGFMTTHTLPLRMFLEHLHQMIRGKILVLAVQPASLRLGSRLSARLRATLHRLEGMLVRALNGVT